MNKHTATKTPPPTQNVRVIVSSIDFQFDAISVQYHGVKIWNNTDPRITKKNIIPACIELI
tara:strand:+ start:61 stop:243 length:183 start_codon:yes stop_codon:yes gene_type:complete